MKRTRAVVRIAVVAVLALVTALLQPPLAQAADTVVEHFYVPVHQGTPDAARISVWVVRPVSSDSRPVPVVASITPYGAPRPAADNEWAKRGFAWAIADTYGTGCSSGTFDIVHPREVQAGAEVVEWLGTQPWSTGKVGLTGLSYPGFMSVLVAGLQPAHLAAIFPIQMTGDLYRDSGYPGGLPQLQYVAWSPGAQERADTNTVPRALAEGDTDCAANQPHLSARFSADFLVHSTDDAWWKERHPLRNASRIRIPMYLANSWDDRIVQPRGVTALWRTVTSPKKLILGAGAHGAFNSDPFVLEERYRWFERWLKGVDNGITKEPPVHVYDSRPVAGRPRMSFKQWPPESADWDHWYLRENGVLSTKPPTGPELPDTFAYPGPGAATVQRDRAVYDMTIDRDITLVGPMVAHLWVTSSAPEAHFLVTLSELGPDGQRTYSAAGYLKGSDRAFDPARSSEHEIFHWHDPAHAAPLPTGTRIPLDIELWPIVHTYPAGSTLRLEVRLVSTPELAAEIPTYPSPLPATVTVHHDAPLGAVGAAREHERSWVNVPVIRRGR